jgi:hypothetical protein
VLYGLCEQSEVENPAILAGQSSCSKKGIASSLTLLAKTFRDGNQDWINCPDFVSERMGRTMSESM